MDNYDLMIRHKDQENAKGGTEMMQERLYSSLPRELLSQFQIWFSRFDESQYDKSKIQILYVHDLPGDPMYKNTLGETGRSRFKKIAFVSNWQMQQFIDFYKLNHDDCLVMKNAIEPINNIILPKPLVRDKLKLIYHTTPHRGLMILEVVFSNLVKKYPIELDVYSSFGVYGWPQRDAEYAQVFDKLRRTQNVNYFGAQKNEVVREALKTAHIFSYPSIWPETSCISLMEAMSAGVISVHPNFGALSETAAGLTNMYPMHQDLNAHASIFHQILEVTIKKYLEDPYDCSQGIANQNYANVNYNWYKRSVEWSSFLINCLN